MMKAVVSLLLLVSLVCALVASSAGGETRRAGAVTLTCADETPPGVQPRFGAGSVARSFGALGLDAVGGWASKRPTGIPVTFGRRRFGLLKAFAYVLRRPPGRVEMTVLAPATVRLYYASGTVWSSNPSPAEIVRGSTRTVSFSACTGPTGYTGGLLIQKPVCVTLRVGVTGRKPRTVRLPIAPARCRA